ncbi:MAG: THUMP domain-containing protein [Limnospira sp. PMC 1291.21]|uniref:THUMP domain-containing protein n=1 Tax=Limnospira fusiformis PMC 851.14 TaxID=2219512 RepID=A0ABU9EJG1_LIMFS|nr:MULTISPECIES: THUMP domain-containing protein [Limnospira]EKD07851.1 putative RNA methylase [Arthrospira platensis C1]MDY7053922.1 THUMP domain-containing protein [Limnospira fusiformis LS22]QJB25540.1 RNA methyltransferase [Limnospira fusiformis SAG 85.79]MDT9179145.1 THUMP domain-containing protein [Limnospira sp. PMC 1238.20]MDT9188361.1 THUMP domain-containing protein [Limnospira sp. PMC 894.15]
MSEYFATVAHGLESVAANELESLGARQVKPDFAGVSFSGDRHLLYKVNLWSRTIFRVLVPIAKFPCPNGDRLYKEVQKIDWEEYIKPHQTLSVHCTGKNRQLNHTHFTALQVKNAIVDQQRDKFSQRSTVDILDADLHINLHINGNHGILSLDSSGPSLHRRGYRPAVGKAPLKESLAAGLLDLAQWQGDRPFLDPLCGSGTLPLEATLKALNVAPGLFRETFALMKWSDFDESLWKQLVREAQASCREDLKISIGGCDRDSEAIAQANYNAKKCGVDSHISLWEAYLSEVEPTGDNGLIVCNPPYGERLGNVEELGDLYQQLGDILKQRFKGWTAFIFTGNKALSKRIGLRTSQRIPLYNGALPCTLLKYELY